MKNFDFFHEMYVFLKKGILSSLLLCLLASSLPFSETLAQNCQTKTFNGTPPVAPTTTTVGTGGTGSIQTYTVPAGVTSIRIDARGAKGGNSPNDVGGFFSGGNGGRVQATYAVTPGDVLYILVAGKGGDGSPDNGENNTASGGGGATVVSNGPIGTGTLLLVAGGGGGAGNFGGGGNSTNTPGSGAGNIGAGGGSFSVNGGNSTFGDPGDLPCGQGGQALNGSGNGGANACFRPETNGGGYGGGGAGNYANNNNQAGGGGGGGYIGGDGGFVSGGNGGSSFADPGATSVLISNHADNDGSVVITALGFTLPANDGSTVACPAAANETPAHPTGIVNLCGEAVIPTGPVISTTPTCEGTKTYTWTYSSQGITQTWVYTYTIVRNDFNAPPNSGAIRVCLAQTEQPIPPVWTDACGNSITPTGPVVVDAPDPLTCEGTRTYIYTYTDCAGHSHDWSFVWTLDVPTLSVDNPGTATVSCPSAPPPTYPNTITDACGRPLTVTGPTVTSSPDPITCEGTRTYTWNLTDCAGNTNTWSWIITIERNDFTLPANGGSTVSCPAAANVVPTPPTKMSECGEPIIPTGPVVSATPACEGTKTYTWTYTDCEGNTHDWVYTYTIERADFTVPANGSATVSCPSDITTPTPPTVTSACGETLTPSTPTIVNSPNPLVCAGTRTYTYTYTDCEGNTHPWSFTYTVSPTLPVTITCPNNLTTTACQTQTAVNTAFADWLATASISGGCDGVLTNNDNVAPSACGGSKTVTFTNENDCGNQSCQATFTVPSPETVTLTCPENQTEAYGQTQAAINNAFAAWLATASASGGCGGTFTNNSVAQGGAPPATGGSVTVTFTKTSTCAPLTTSCQATFSVSNTPPIVLTCPTNATASSACLTQAQLTAEYNNWLDLASGTGGCNGALTNDGSTPPTICSATATVKTVEFTYTSTCAPLTTTCVANFTVPAYPDFNAPPNSGAIRVCLAQTEQPIPPVVHDACGKPITPSAPTVVDGPDPLTCEGTRTYIYTYTDCAGHSHDWSFVWTLDVPTLSVDNPGTATVACPSAPPPTYPNTITDACGRPLTVTGPTVTSSPDPITCEGTRTYTWNLMDCAGNTNTWSWIITIERNDFTLPANGSATVSCPSDITTPTPPTVTSACGETLTPSTPSIVDSPNPLVCAGTRTFTYTYTDCEGNTHDWSFTYTVSPTLPVTITCPNNLTTTACQTQTAVNTAFANWLSDASISGGCDGVLTNNDNIAPSACGGSKTVTFTNENDCGNQSCQATFTVPSPETVTLTCPGDQTEAFGQTQTAINNAFTAWLATASASGGCGGTFTNGNPTAPPATGGSVTVTFTKTSTCAPLTTSCQATFTVSAIPPVVLTCPTNATASSACLTQAQLTAEYNNWLDLASGTGGCNGSLSNNGSTPPTICSATATVKTVEFTYTSTCAPLTTTCQANFTVPAYPTFSVPANAMATVACPALATQETPPTVLDGCGKTLTPTGPVITNLPDPLTCEGSRTYVWTYTDCAGNAKTWSRIYTIERNDFTVPANGSATVACPSAITTPTPPTVTSNCGETITPTGPAVSATPACEGTKTYTWTYTDCEGNSHDWVFTYTIERNDFTLPANGAATVACPSAITTPTPPTVTSNCGETLTPTGPAISATPACEGTKTYTWTYTDCEGNSHDWVFTYTVDDQTPPTITCPANTTVAANATCQAILANYTGNATASDNCTASPTKTQSPASGTTLGLGNQTVTLTATDCSGLTGTCNFTVSVTDQTPPTVVCKPFTANLTAAGTASITTANVFQSGADNCGIVNQVSVTPNSFTCSNLGANTVTLLVNDGNGNTANCTATITILDLISPTITCPANLEELNDVGFCSKKLTFIGTPVAADNCQFSLTNNSPQTFEVGETLVTWRVTDQAGNMATCEQTVTIFDAENPILTCPTGISAIAQEDVFCGANIDFQFSATDNCPGLTIEQSHFPGEIFDLGNTDVEIKIEDAAGNTAECQFSIWVDPREEICNGLDDDCDGFADELQEWVFDPKIFTKNPTAQDAFGGQSDLLGDWAIVGASRKNAAGQNIGAAFLYHHDPASGLWLPATSFFPNGQVSGDQFFGAALSLGNGFVAIGSPGDDDNGLDAGAVYLYKQDANNPFAWSFLKKLLGTPGDAFGSAVEISGEALLVGAKNEGANDAGAAHLFSKNEGGADNFGLLKKLVANDPDANDHFGSAVALTQNYALVAAIGDDEKGTDAGAAYIFGRQKDGPNAWGRIRKITANDGAAGDQFGASADLDGAWAILGAPADDDKGLNSGSTYIFNKNQGNVADSWGFRTKLTDFGGAKGDAYGTSISIYGDYLAVGAPGKWVSQSGAGKVFIYVLTSGNWVELTQLSDPDGAFGDNLGGSVSLDKGNLLAGIPGDDKSGIPNTGSVIFFEGICSDDQKPSGTSDFAAANFAVSGFPNPFSDAVNIQLDLPDAGAVQLSVFNSLGMKVADVFDGKVSGGRSVFRWEAGRLNLPPGIYTLVVNLGEAQKTLRLAKLED